MRKVTFVVGNRAHFARIMPIVQSLQGYKIKYKIILFDSASVADFGDVFNDITKIVSKKDISTLFSHISGSNLLTMTKSAGYAISELGTELFNNKPDIVVVIGDRYEALSAAVTARYMNICLAHVMGGEVSGSIDDSIRHAITKLANIHFVSNSECKDNLMGMGEVEDNIHITGCPTMDLFKKVNEQDIRHITTEYCDINENHLGRKYIIVSFHPVTTEYSGNQDQFRKLLGIIVSLNVKVIWIYPNVDAGGDLIRQEIEKFRKQDQNGNIHFFKHFNILQYLTILNNALCIVGNSSVGIRESSFIGLPSINIGTRQNLRQRANNVLDCNIDSGELKNSILKQIEHGKYKPSFLYGHGDAGPKIAKILNDCEFNYKKDFQYNSKLDDKK
ncbi:UDP-N-acetylglucosamine 2-epimerase (hydrolyzing) [Clostridium estertheticum]|uniref:UDP-N-acetylglucosamine 2-epimerase n=1 Tax=Clostridium estertheticum TaxID=238834 RepID=UPI001C0DC162|nr:UDP-N-acetylglucosamine 2-epimerase [Clostridium estertheticum]MBU3175915.1 UDP-N-acetylglucosamine 2-epimerase (hydrolyzing) [Clostridium estertheticum]